MPMRLPLSLLAVIAFCALQTTPWAIADIPSGEHANLTEVLRQEYTQKVSAASDVIQQSFKGYQSNPIAYDRFLDTHMEPLWNMRSTTQALVGRPLFNTLTHVQANALKRATTRTFRRYAFEGLARYTGQSFAVHNVLVNAQGTRGWVQVVMRSDSMLNVYLDLLVKRGLDGQWRTVDVRFQGIAYVATKKYMYRTALQSGPVAALIDTLREKNVQFFSELCARHAVGGEKLC